MQAIVERNYGLVAVALTSSDLSVLLVIDDGGAHSCLSEFFDIFVQARRLENFSYSDDASLLAVDALSN